MSGGCDTIMMNTAPVNDISLLANSGTQTIALRSFTLDQACGYTITYSLY